VRSTASSVGETATEIGSCYKQRVVPIPIAELRERLMRERRRAVHLVAGRILDERPRGAQPLPIENGAAVLARIDIEETAPLSRPLLTRRDLLRDFWLADESGRALVRTGDPDLDLRIDAPFREELRDEGVAYVRSLRTGDPVYVWGRAALLSDPEGCDGYRDAVVVEIAPSSRICDEAAFRQLSAWRALPWYRKLSVLVRNR